MKMKTKLFLCLLTAALLSSGCGRSDQDISAKTSSDTLSQEISADESSASASDEDTAGSDAKDTQGAAPSKDQAADASSSKASTATGSDAASDKTAAEDDEADEDDEPEEDDYVTPEDSAFASGPEDGTGTDLLIEDEDEMVALEDDVPDYLMGNQVVTPSDGSGGIGEGTIATPGSLYTVPNTIASLTFPSDEVSFTGDAGNYKVNITDAQVLKSDEGTQALSFTFSFTNDSLPDTLLLDTLNLTVTDQDNIVLQNVSENNKSLAALEPAEVGQTRSFTVRYHLNEGAQTATVYYADMTLGTGTASWTIDLAGLG